jgi:hypothetical protein
MPFILLHWGVALTMTAWSSGKLSLAGAWRVEPSVAWGHLSACFQITNSLMLTFSCLHTCPTIQVYPSLSKTPGGLDGVNGNTLLSWKTTCKFIN